MQEATEVEDSFKMKTAIKMWGTNYSTNVGSETYLGEVFLTYYIAFKTRRHTT